MYSAPYSTFVLLLRNHRLIYIHDQSGVISSPGVESFAKTVYDYYMNFRRNKMTQFMNEKENKSRLTKRNKRYDELNKEFSADFPPVEVNISGITTAEGLSAILRKLEKIQSVRFRVFPLNAELDEEPVFAALRATKANNKIENAEINLSGFGARAVENVTHLIHASNGQANYLIKGRERDETTGVLRERQITDEESTERITADIGDVSDQRSIAYGAYQVVQDNTIIRSDSSAENLSLYNGFVETFQ